MKAKVKRDGGCDLLKGRILANIFYEPSTRTMCSFAAAMLRLGGQVIPVNESSSSAKKGETLSDTIRCLEAYADILVLRHPAKGSAAEAAAFASKPLINAVSEAAAALSLLSRACAPPSVSLRAHTRHPAAAGAAGTPQGDGTGEHPTQALLDLYTMRSELGELSGLTVTCLGDLKHGRTVHSLVQLCALFGMRVNLVSPASLRMPADVLRAAADGAGGSANFAQHDSLEAALEATDVLYVTRVQRERFDSEAEYDAVKVCREPLLECPRACLTPRACVGALGNSLGASAAPLRPVQLTRARTGSGCTPYHTRSAPGRLHRDRRHAQVGQGADDRDAPAAARERDRGRGRRRPARRLFSADGVRHVRAHGAPRVHARDRRPLEDRFEARGSIVLYMDGHRAHI